MLKIAISVLVGVGLGVASNLVSNLIAPSVAGRRRLTWSVFIGLIALSVGIAFIPDSSLHRNENDALAIVDVSVRQDERHNILDIKVRNKGERVIFIKRAEIWVEDSTPLTLEAFCQADGIAPSASYDAELPLTSSGKPVVIGLFH